ncbi:MAG: GDSL family lipase, partial [Coleofasciculaceae cyanobacterium SM2_3_26]|nr:GDSL family lipase [Coleofasciculaceae cyanobacterium SM2_3_26]
MLKPLLTAGVVLTTVLSSPATLAATFSRVFTFGDSLSDTGNVF